MKVKCQVCNIVDEDFRLMLVKFYNPERLQCIGCSAKQSGAKYVKRMKK